MRASRFVVVCSVMSGVLVLGLQTGWGVTRYVSPTGGNAPPYTNWAMAAQTINAAVAAAATGDEIVVTNGVYTIAATINLEKGLLIRSVNGADVTTVDGGGNKRCFWLDHANDVVEGFTITRGGNWLYGAGVYIHSGGGTLRRCKITDSVATDSGGGVYGVQNGRLEECEFRGNRASGSGAGAYIGVGGSVSGCVFSGNSAGNAGGGLFLERMSTVQKSSFTSNSAVNHGGGLHCSSTGSLIDACVVTDNIASNWDGGGVFFNNTNTIRNTLITRNRSGQGAGGLFVRDSRVESCTIVSNHSANWGGLEAEDDSTIWNSIVLFNTAVASTSNFNHNVSAVYTGCCIAPLPPTGGGNFTADPMFVNAGAGNYRLMSNSPCIDRNVAIGPATRDLDGVLRPQDGNGDGVALYDVGAYERERPRSGAVNDYSGNGISDFPVFNPPDGAWYIRRISGPTITWSNQWGWSTARPVVGDYNGDGKWDLAVFDTVGGYWYIKSIAGGVIAWQKQWGWSTAKPVPGDYDGDRKWDLAVFDTAGGYWYIRKAVGGTITWANQWGWSTAKPVPGDYDGDGKWDMAVFDTAGGRWYIQRVAGTPILWANQWGWSTAKPVPGDYDGDGKWDQAVFDTAGGFWYIKKVTGQVIAWANQWGWSTAKPVPGDYDGDGKCDLALYDTATGLWYVKSLDGRVLAWASQWGWPGATIPALEAAQ